MVEYAALRWVVTVVLVATGVAHLPGVFRGNAAVIRFDALTHAAMALSMAAMAWPWHNDLAVWPQVAFFAAAAAWFTAHSAVIVLDGEIPARVAWVPAAHASGLYAMVWMLVAMTLPVHHEHHHTAEPSAASAPAVVLGGVMLVVTVWWATKAFRLLASPKRRRRAWSPASHAVVHAAMALMLLELA